MATLVRPRFLPMPYQDSPESGRLILRDGSTAHIRLAGPKHKEMMREFFLHLSTESRRRRFFSPATPSQELIASLCDNSNPSSKLTLVATRIEDDRQHIIATGSYLAKDAKTAEVAFAVDDAFQGKGLGTLLLERLALLAARHGFTRFWAISHAGNRAMIGVFRDSGFEVHETLEGGEVEVDFSVVPTQASVTRLEMRDRIATATSLRPLFKPNAVAVIGASRDPDSIGYRVFDALVSNKFPGPVYPVNPKASEVAGKRAYASVRDLPEQVDLAVIVVPRNAVLNVVDDCAARGVRALVVISAGFAETGAEGRQLQEQLLEKVRGYGMRMVGPNCLGVINTDSQVRLNASFSPVYPLPGRIAMSSQSGALGLAVLTATRRLNLGLSTFVSVGNKADVSGNDLLQYWEEDENTDVILFYLESFGNPRRFARIARRVGQRKPIIAIKSGRTKAGGRAAASHTAALAASDVAVDALFHQTGVIRTQTLEEMFDLAALLGSQPLPVSRRVGIVTNAGGPGIQCADACEASGLVVTELSASLQKKLGSFLPHGAGLSNPVDMIASATGDQYEQAIEALLVSGEVDSVIVIYIPIGLVETEAISSDIGHAVRKAREKGAAQPVLLCWMGDESRMQLAVNKEHIPCYAFPETPAQVLGKAAKYAEWRAEPPGVIPDFDDLDLKTVHDVCQKALAARGRDWLTADETRTVLTAMKLPLPPGTTARSADEAMEAARRIGFPVAVKLASRKIIHKSDVGGVFLNLPDADAVRNAFSELRSRLAARNELDAMDGVIVQPMIQDGVELMIGTVHDPLFGPLVAFGLGGVHVEILGDVVFRISPLTDRDASEMLRSIRGFKLLEGYRDHPPADVAALEEVLLRISRLVEEFSEIHEIDLNPLVALPPGQGCRILDARIRVEPVAS